MTLSPLHSSQAFLEQGGKEDYRCSLGELPGFTSTTQKALRSQISGVAGGRALGVFWCPHSPTKGALLSFCFGCGQQDEACPGLHFWPFLVRRRAKPKSFQGVTNRKKKKKLLPWGLFFPLRGTGATFQSLHGVFALMHCAISKITFEESENLKGMG